MNCSRLTQVPAPAALLRPSAEQYASATRALCLTEVRLFRNVWIGNRLHAAPEKQVLRCAQDDKSSDRCGLAMQVLFRDDRKKATETADSSSALRNDRNE